MKKRAVYFITNILIFILTVSFMEHAPYLLKKINELVNNF